MLKVSKMKSLVQFQVNFIVRIFKHMVSNIRVFLFLRAGIVFVESCKQISSSLTTVVAAERAMNTKYLHNSMNTIPAPRNVKT